MTIVHGLQDTALRAALGIASPGGARGRLSIAIFHRVLPQPDPLFPDEVDRTRFDMLCRWLATWFKVLPLDQAVEAMDEGRLPPRALSITFDDGYADNHDLAMPILQSHGLSATFFVATGYLDGGRMWNDTVIETLRRCRADALDLSDLGLEGLARLDLSNLDARRSALNAVLGAAKYLAPPVRQAAVDEIARRAGVELPTDLMMRSDQVRALRDGGMQIGAHTLGHPILARVDDDTARAEIGGSKARLEALLNQPVPLFAYPNGRPGRDYGPRDVAIVRELGFRAAVSTSYGAARTGDGLGLQLPRFTPWDRGRAAFGLRMVRNLGETPASASG